MSRSVRLSMIAALSLAACHPRDQTADLAANDQLANAAAELPENPSQAQLCQSINGESAAGKHFMINELTEHFTDQLGADRIGVLSKSADYFHVGSEMLGGHCWTDGEIKSDPADPVAFDTTIRCPVLMVSNDPAQAGKTLVEDMDDNHCEFGVPVGAPPKTPVSSTVQFIPDAA